MAGGTDTTISAQREPLLLLLVGGLGPVLDPPPAIDFRLAVDERGAADGFAGLAPEDGDAEDMSPVVDDAVDAGVMPLAASCA